MNCFSCCSYVLHVIHDVSHTPSKGTKPYNLAKEIYDNALSLGCNNYSAAGLVGNAEAEGAMNGDPMQQEQDSNNGLGIFQFTPASSNRTGWSVKEQVAEMLRRGCPKDAGSIQEATNAVLAVEAPQDPNQIHKRGILAQQAYDMFHRV